MKHLGLALVLLALAGGVAVAQPAGPQELGGGAPTPAAARAQGERVAAPAQAKKSDASPGSLKNSKATALLFWFFALACVGGAVFVITRRNLVAAVMGLVGTFFAIAAVYVMLYAHFIAAIQVLVYAGAIMVLFVFVVMILNRSESEPWSHTGTVGKGVAAVALVYLLTRLGQVLWKVQETAAADPAAVVGQAGDYAFGSTRAVGMTLFNEYLFPFEAVSIVLLVAVVGAIAVARPAKLAEQEKAA